MAVRKDKQQQHKTNLTESARTFFGCTLLGEKQTPNHASLSYVYEIKHICDFHVYDIDFTFAIRSHVAMISKVFILPLSNKTVLRKRINCCTGCAYLSEVFMYLQVLTVLQRQPTEEYLPHSCSRDRIASPHCNDLVL